MQTKFIEVTNGPRNWGKFMIGRFSIEEWSHPSFVTRRWDIGLIARCGWTQEHILVFDLQTGEGALFKPGGCAKADLNKHKIWVCPMFEPFLEWLYKQKLDDFEKLPSNIDLPDAPFAFSGYRRSGISSAAGD